MYDAQGTIEAFADADYGQVLRSALPFAEAGNADAQCMIALLYECGYGVPQDAVIAESWLRRAVEQDHALAWNNLGTLYLLGLPGVPRDREKAQKCYMRAKELGFDCAYP